MKQAEKLELALWVRDTLVPLLRAKGEHHPAGAEGPTHWLLDTPELRLVYSEGALLSPDDRSLSCLLDVWVDRRKKVLSLSWEADRPWQPVRIALLARGPWHEELVRMVG
jgi:hypothetical protein